MLTVIEEEFDAVRYALGATERYHAKPRRYWHEPAGTSRFVLVRMADRGNGPAQETTRALIEHWHPDIVLLVGIAGALDTGPAGLGDVVIPDYIHYGDFRKITEGSDALRFAAYDQPTVSLRADSVEGVKIEGKWPSRLTATPPGASRGLLARIALRNQQPRAPRVEIGGIVAGEKVLGDPDHAEQERIFVSFDHAIAVDMESFGVARAVHDARSDPGYNPRLSVVRGISDIVHRKPQRDVKGALLPRMPAKTTAVDINNQQRTVWKRYAAATAAAFAGAVVDEVAP